MIPFEANLFIEAKGDDLKEQILTHITPRLAGLLGQAKNRGEVKISFIFFPGDDTIPRDG